MKKSLVALGIAALVVSCTGGSAGVGGGSNSSGFNNEDRKDNSNDDNFTLVTQNFDNKEYMNKEIKVPELATGELINIDNSYTMTGILNEGTVNKIQNGTRDSLSNNRNTKIWKITNKGFINQIVNEKDNSIGYSGAAIDNYGVINKIENKGGIYGSILNSGKIKEIEYYDSIQGMIDLGDDNTLINNYLLSDYNSVTDEIKLGNGTLNLISQDKIRPVTSYYQIEGGENSQLNLSNVKLFPRKKISVGTINVDNNSLIALASNKEYGSTLRDSPVVIEAKKEFILNGILGFSNESDYNGNYHEVKTPYFINNGEIRLGGRDWGSKEGDRVLLIDGNYQGESGSKIIFNISNTAVFASYSVSDANIDGKLIIKGNANGESEVFVDVVKISPDKITRGITKEIIRVEGQNNATFRFGGVINKDTDYTGSLIYGYRLIKGNGGKSICVTNAVSANCNAGLTAMSASAPTQVAATPQAVEKIYRPLVSMYVESQKANNEQGEIALNNLTSREEKDKLGNNTWFRYYGSDRKNDGEKRFGHEQKVNGVQIGQDIYNKDNKVAGVFIDYSHADTKMEDRVREKVEKDAGYTKNVGKMSFNLVGLGGYFTKKFDNSYIDGVLLLSTVENKFKDIDNKNATQKGYRIGSLVEYGHTLFDKNDLKVEGRAQLAYQRTTYKKFNDGVQEIKKYTTNELTGTVGTKVTKNFGVASVYGTLDIKNYFITPKGFDATSEVIKEKYDRTGYVAGIGAEFGEDRFKVYLDGKYGRSFKGHDREAKATLGFKFSY